MLATGFDAMTGALLRIDIRGRGGLTLAQAWSAGPKTYLGIAVAGFPNLFTITGPGSPSVLTNMIPTIEQHVDWIADAIRHMRERGSDSIEASADAQERWAEHLRELASPTLRYTCTPGISAPMCRASRACSCPISAAFHATCSNAAMSPPAAMRDLRCVR